MFYSLVQIVLVLVLFLLFSTLDSTNHNSHSSFGSLIYRSVLTSCIFIMINLSPLSSHSIILQVRADWSGHHHDSGQERSLRLAQVGSQDHGHGPASPGTQPGPVRHPLQGMQDTRVIGLLLRFPPHLPPPRPPSGYK